MRRSASTTPESPSSLNALLLIGSIRLLAAASWVSRARKDEKRDGATNGKSNVPEHSEQKEALPVSAERPLPRSNERTLATSALLGCRSLDGRCRPPVAHSSGSGQRPVGNNQNQRVQHKHHSKRNQESCRTHTVLRQRLAHRWRPLTGVRLRKPRRGAAIR
jgi:hypothetical protein